MKCGGWGELLKANGSDIYMGPLLDKVRSSPLIGHSSLSTISTQPWGMKKLQRFIGQGENDSYGVSIGSAQAKEAVVGSNGHIDCVCLVDRDNLRLRIQVSERSR